MHDEKIGKTPARHFFRYLRSTVVPFTGQRPSSIPFAHILAWEPLHDRRFCRVYYIKVDGWRTDGLSLSRRWHRDRLDSQIVDAVKLGPFVPRYANRPTHEQRLVARAEIAKWRRTWEIWAAEHQPTLTIRSRLERIIDRLCGPQFHARQVVLDSETEFTWLSSFPRYGQLFSYLEERWHKPRVPNGIRAGDIPGVEIIGFMAVDPGRQLRLNEWTQRVYVIPWGVGGKDFFYGAMPLKSYRKRDVVLSSIHPGCEAVQMAPEHLCVIERQMTIHELIAHKRRWLNQHEEQHGN